MTEIRGEEVPGPVTPGVAEKVGWVRRMYDWVLSYAEKPHGGWALFGFSFAESSFFPIPPDPLLVALAIGSPKRALRFAAICTAGSVLGAMAGYAIGAGIWSAVDQFFYTYVPGVSPASFARVRELYDTYDFWAILAAGFTPIPFKVFTLSAGAFAISFPVFLLASTVSRAARFFIVAGLIYAYGPSIQGFIDRHFDRLAWLFLILLVGGFVVIKLVLD
ncbi:MAG TPA: YqaA family protein [Longimicrobiales bacterium]|nr:YqaA family protein [Longimicrobiales bacterium]